ncbi:unnamed protein product, partial [Mesorhabditis belari]|uniref:Acyl-coenzyme A thioesterase 8 n=1 Tax=Mesorhabditis belari TaxID=2138241 RepID=A0AAF3F2Z7_9BILA
MEQEEVEEMSEISTQPQNGSEDEDFDEKADLLNTFLDLEELDTDLYRSTHQLRGRKAHNRVYGGQVVGQALMAAHRTIDSEFKAHSLHCNFLYAADADRPLLYQVSRIRDGRSFATRLVRAKQGGRAIFSSSISFQKIEPDSITHQQRIPDVPPPEECEDAQDFLRRLIADPKTVSVEGQRAAEAYQQVLDFPKTFRIKFIKPRAYVQGALDEPMKFAVWVKNNALLGEVEHIHHCVAAFISDIAPIGTPIAIHAAKGFRLGMAASLDHSMWIHHHDFKIDDDWVLYETESTIAAACRALIHGKMWTRDGRMVLSSTQEILIRGQRDDEPVGQKKRSDSTFLR